MDLRVDPSRPESPSRQLVDAVLFALAKGDLAVGDRLPSVRTLAAEALVNPNTVGKAYRELELLGVVEGRSGAGVFVTSEGPALARKDRRGRTLDGLRQAVEAALAAGHDPERILALVEDHLPRSLATGIARTA